MPTKTEGQTADETLIAELKRIAQEAPHLADPRDGVRAIAEALTVWFES